MLCPVCASQDGCKHKGDYGRRCWLAFFSDSVQPGCGFFVERTWVRRNDWKKRSRYVG